MPDPSHSPAAGRPAHVSGPSPIDVAAEAWARRLQAGLSSDEEVEFAEWLAADARHEMRLRQYQAAWDRFAPMAKASADLTADPGGLAGEASAGEGGAPPPGASRARAGLRFARWVGPAVGLAAGLALLLAVAPIRPWRSAPAAASIALPPACEQRTLADGSVIEINRGAVVSVQFTATERRVRLERGEAIFTVAENPQRPFIVTAGAVDVRAVGTAFNVRFEPAAVEVLVTKGRVRIEESELARREPAAPPTSGRAVADSPADGTLVDAGQSALVTLSPAAPPPQVTTLTAQEIEARLAWQPKLLDFDDAPLAEIVAEFNRRNPVRLVIDDPAIAKRRLAATFRSDNLEAFVRLLESNIGVQARWRSDTEIALEKRP